MKRSRLLAALAATLALCAALALHDGDEIVAARPARATDADGRAGDAGASGLARAAPARRTGLAAASPRGDWPPPADATVAAWSAPASGAANPVAAAPQPAAPTAGTAPAQQPPPPAPPRAPAPGFELIGTVLEGQVRGALIQSPLRSLWVRAGDTVDSAWRVEQVHADRVELMWLPQQLPAALRYRAP